MRRLVALAGTLLLAACTSAAPSTHNPYDDYVPDLQGFSAQPETTKGPQPITLSAYATSPKKLPVEYHWTADSGILSATTGDHVTWRPTNAEGVVQPGVATITLVATAGGYSNSAMLPFRIAADGSVTTHGAGSGTQGGSGTSTSTVTTGDATPAPAASADTGASAVAAACSASGLKPTWAAPGSIMVLTGAALPAKPALTVGAQTVTPILASATSLAFLTPTQGGSSPQAVTLASCGKGDVSPGSWLPLDTSDYGAPVTVPDAGLLAEVGQGEAGADRVPDLASFKAQGSFLVPGLDLPARNARVALPLADPSLPTVIRFTGKLQVTAPGPTHFNLVASQGAKLYLDGKLVVDADVGTPRNGADGDATLTAGSHALRIDYLQGPGSLIGLQLYWTPPGAQEAVVPPGLLSPGLREPGEPGGR